jgi:glyoxylase-like metal-dependent hydrolase (beta-lactamase superfamily II)/rhodanese-related sulfurtransferase
MAGLCIISEANGSGETNSPIAHGTADRLPFIEILDVGLVSEHIIHELRPIMLVKQIRSNDGTGTLTYVITNDEHQTGCIIDPNIEDLPRIELVTRELGIRLTHIIDTHTHADHVSAAGELRQKTGAQTIMHTNTRNKWKIIDQGDKFGIGDTLRANAKIPIDRYVEDGDVVTVGSLTVNILFTPGHTDNHISPFVGGSVFTGDLLLIGQAGRSDLPGGDPEEQYDSLFNKILTLPAGTKIYPGHDYQDLGFAYLEDEKKTNPFLQPRTKQQFVEFVKDFFPPFAENVASGGKMTLQCGVQRVAQHGESIKNMTAQELHARKSNGDEVFVLDVREPIELLMSGAIEGVINVPIGSLKDHLHVLPKSKQAEIVCVCQSGSRSIEATHYLQQQGYGNVLNLTGGTNSWKNAGFPIVRSGQPARMGRF